MRVRLAIETSNPSAHQPGLPAPGVAIGVVESSGVRVLDSETIDTRPGADDDLLPAIARVFARYNLTPRDLDSIAVSIGPGGYTALRIAAATAQMLAMSTGAACLGVPSALVAYAAFADRSRRVAVALSSKDQTAYITIFDAATPNPHAGSPSQPAARPPDVRRRACRPSRRRAAGRSVSARSHEGRRRRPRAGPRPPGS
jgi:tRNA threonylcarbamoyl adenosine modification protein YeaZ